MGVTWNRVCIFTFHSLAVSTLVFFSICTSNYCVETLEQRLIYSTCARDQQQWHFSSRLRCNLSAWSAAKLWRLERAEKISTTSCDIQLIFFWISILSRVLEAWFDFFFVVRWLLFWTHLALLINQLSFFWDGTRFNPFPPSPRACCFFQSLIWIEFWVLNLNENYNYEGNYDILNSLHPLS